MLRRLASLAVAVYTGTKMIVWGGIVSDGFDTFGGTYDPGDRHLDGDLGSGPTASLLGDPRSGRARK
jgi:hypothetical protein